MRTGAVTPLDAVKAWILAQGCSREFIEANGGKILSQSAYRSLCAKDLKPLLVSFNLRLDELTAMEADEECTLPCTAHSWPQSTWEACATSLCVDSEHDPRNFISGEQVMSQYNDCSHYVALESELRRRLSPAVGERLCSVPLVLYAVQNASEARLDEAVAACASVCNASHTEAQLMKDTAKKYCALHKTEDIDEYNRQYVTVLRAAHFDPNVADMITHNRALWPTVAATQSTSESTAVAPDIGTDINMRPYESSVRTQRSLVLDHPADVSAKAFAQEIEFSPLHNIDDVRFAYLVAGMRNSSALFSSLFSDEPEHTQNAFSRYTTTSRGAALHDDQVFPNLLAAVFEQPRPDRFMEHAQATLMADVNSFVRSLYGSGAPLPSDEELPSKRRVVMWLTANSRGDAAHRLSQWCGVNDSIHLNNLSTYLRSTTGPSQKAMHALRNIYFSGVGGDGSSSG